MRVGSRRINRGIILTGPRGRFSVFGAAVLILLGTGAGTAVANDDTKVIRIEGVGGVAEGDRFVEDEFIVVLSQRGRADVAVGVGPAGRPTVSIQALQNIIDRNGVVRFARQFPTARPQPANGRFRDLTGYFKARIDGDIDLDAAMEAFAGEQDVDHVEKIGIHPITGCATGTPRTPNDTWFDNPPPTFSFPQWDLWDVEGMDADMAWSISTGDGTVVVVAMDTGVRYFHTDLGGNDPPGPADNVTDGNVWVNPFEIPNNGVDDEGNGKVDDVVGWDFVTGVTGCTSGEDCSTQDNDPRDFNGHGTHTAGTMAAITNNARGVAGIAGGFGDGTTGSAGNGSKIMCMRIGWSTPTGGFVRMDFAAEAMNYVADMKNRGVNIAAVNCSWGSSNSGGINAAVDNLLAADVMVIHAAGNGNSSTPDFLGNKAGVMNVAATDQNGNKANFSNFGSWVDLAAPGVDIISTYHNSADPANDYVAVMDGTSMAAPHVTGMAALLESCDNGLSGPDKFSIMVNNGCLAGSPNIGDVLNAKLALDAVLGGCGGCSVPGDCDDLNECTLDDCVGGVCQNTPLADNAGCTGGVCCSGTCTAPACSTGADCDEPNDCTSDACNNPGTCSASCSNSALPDDTGCAGGVCCGGTCTAPVCSSDADCADADACTTDTCSSPATCLAACANDPVICPPGETCVNGVCEPEVCNNDGTCDPGEDCNNCSNDCISATGGTCGDGICAGAPTEDCDNCSADCRCTGGPNCNRSCCGDGACVNENTSNCPVDCDPGFQAPQGFCCGDGTCEGAEDECNCAVDCPGTCPTCGDGSCDPGEDQCNCATDCGMPPANEVQNATCDDGVDNDCDGDTDCADADCTAPPGDPACVCGQKNDPCSLPSDCCSNKCKRNGTCK